MASIYSKRLADGSITGSANTTVYTAPAGTTAVVHTITLTPISGTLCNTQVLRNTGAILFSTASGTGLESQVISGRWVLNPGDELNVYCASGTWEYFISGYELTS